MNNLSPMLGSYGLPEGVAAEAVMGARCEHKRGSPRVVTLTAVRSLPPRYEGLRHLPDFTPREAAAYDEKYLSFTTGQCAVIALPRIERTTWVNDGSGWRNAGATVTA